MMFSEFLEILSSIILFQIKFMISVSMFRFIPALIAGRLRKLSIQMSVSIRMEAAHPTEDGWTSD